MENVYNSAANLFTKLQTQFHQNRTTFVGNITKTFWSFFRDIVYNKQTT